MLSLLIAFLKNMPGYGSPGESSEAHLFS